MHSDAVVTDKRAGLIFLAASLLVYSPSEGRAVNWHWLVLRMMYPHDWLFCANLVTLAGLIFPTWHTSWSYMSVRNASRCALGVGTL